MDKITQPKVLKSNAGYYIGTEYLDIELDRYLPYERLSGYFKTAPDAVMHLSFYIMLVEA